MDREMPPMQQLWFDAIGRQYLPTAAPALGVCECCGSEGMCYPRAAEVFCGGCWTLGAKKPMQTKEIAAGPNGSHVMIATRSSFRYMGDLRPLSAVPAGVTIEPARYPELSIADFVLRPPREPTYFVQLDRAYREIVRGCRLTISSRAVHLNGPAHKCVDATAIRDVLQCMNGDWPDLRELGELSNAKTQFGKGPLGGKAYQDALALLNAWHDRFPQLRELLSIKGAWPVEPQTDSWSVFHMCVRHLRQGDLSL